MNISGVGRTLGVAMARMLATIVQAATIQTMRFTNPETRTDHTNTVRSSLRCCASSDSVIMGLVVLGSSLH